MPAGNALEDELRRVDFTGPVGIGAFVYRDEGGAVKLKPIVEINPRYTMGRVLVELMRQTCQNSFGAFRLVNAAQLRAEGFDNFADYARSLAEKFPLQTEGEPLPRYYDSRIWPLADNKGRSVGKLVTLRDISDLKRAELELKSINAELDWFAHSVSHDLKAPISSVCMAADVLARLLEGTDRTDVLDVAAMISRNAWNASERVKLLLKLAESGLAPTDTMGVDVRATVGDVLDDLSSTIEERSATIEVADDLGTVVASPTQIYQVFSNLIGNALAHSDRSGPRVRVLRLDHAESGEHVFLVCDNGAGIAPERLEKIFLPFQKSERTGGTGIGLAIVRKIAEVYAGSVRAYNDKGACFEFTMNDWPSEGAADSGPGKPG